MSETMDKSRDSVDSAPSEEENDPSAQPNIALMFELKEREIARKKRRTRTAVLLFSLAVLVGAGGYLWMRSTTPPGEPATGDESPPPASAVTAKEVREQVGSNYILKTIGVNGVRGRELSVGLYDFDANRFLRGKEVVDNPGELRRLLAERGADLKSSFIVIFAGASFDGEPGNNRNLCRRRGCYVGRLASSIPGVAPNKLWVIAAGEHKSRGRTGTDEEEKEESVRASPEGEQTLSAQRKLLLITIPSDAAVGTAPEAVRVVVDALRRGNFLPTDYDHGQSEPTPFADMQCDLLTP